MPKRCTIHCLRKGGAGRLAEAGASTKEIMSITGHKTYGEVQRYVDATDKAQLARQANGEAEQGEEGAMNLRRLPRAGDISGWRRGRS